MPIAQEIVLAQKFVAESLKQYEPTIIDTVYPELWGYEGMYHNAIADLQFGTREFVQARRDYTGRAVNFGGKATTIPLVNFGMNMDGIRAQAGVAAWEMSWDEAKAQEAAQANLFMPQSNLIQDYRRSLERALREWMHIKTIFGDRSLTFTGLINNPYVEVINVPAASNGVTAAAATASTAYEWFRVERAALKKQSKLTGAPTTVLTSTDVVTAMQKRFGDNTSDGTPYELLTRNGTMTMPSFARIIECNEMAGSAVRDPDVGNLSGTAVLGGQDLNDDNFDLVLMYSDTSDTAPMKHYHDIETTEIGLLDDMLTLRQVGVCATSEMYFSQPFLARLYILRKV